MSAGMLPAEARALARKWAEVGVPAFPIGLSWNYKKKSIDKKPLTTHGFKDASTDPDVVEEMFLKARLGPGQEWGVGLYPGPAGLIVRDVDVKGGGTGLEDLARLEIELGPTPGTMDVSTASGGFHKWNKRPGKPSEIGNVNLAPGIEIRCDAGYVVAPGTTSPWGSWQRLEDTTRLRDLEPLTDNWAGRLNGHAPGGVRDPIAEKLTVGQRHGALLRLAGAMRRQGAGYAEILAALTVMNEQRCDPPKPAGDLVALAKDIAGRYAPEPDIEFDHSSPPAGDNPLGIYDLDALLDIDMSDPEWLIEGIWPLDAYGALGAIFKAGKTWLGCDLAVSVASGGAWCGKWRCPAGGVLYFFSEGSRRKLRRRLEAVARHKGVELKGLPIHYSTIPPNLTDPGVVEQVIEAVARLRPRLVIIDPFYLSAPNTKLSDLVAVGGVLASVQQITDQYGCSLLIIHHWNQTGKGTGAERFSGAGLAEWGRVLISANAIDLRQEEGNSETLVTLDVTGDEVAHQVTVLRRTIRADGDPQSLATPLHYEITEQHLPNSILGNPKPSTRELVKAAFDLPGRVLTKSDMSQLFATWGHMRLADTCFKAAKELVADGYLTELEPQKTSDPIQFLRGET